MSQFRCQTTLLPATVSLILAVVCLSCVTLSPVDSRPEKPAAAETPETFFPHWQPLAAGGRLAYLAGRIAKPRLELRALRVELAQVRIVVSDNALSAKVSSFVRDKELLAGINALPFDPVSDREGEQRTNVGIVVSAGKLISQPRAGYDALVFYADGSAAIVPQAGIRTAENIQNAVGGFHRLLERGVSVARVSAARHPRSAAGLSADGKFLFLLVIDGRRPGSIGATEAETALVLKALGAAEGLNLDGGGSSALALRYPDGAVRAANIPVHGGFPGRERAVGACMGIGQ